MFHRPSYSSGFHSSDLQLQQAFGPIFEQRGVQLVINGHEHNYERLVPWRESGPQAVTYVITGGAGAALRTVGQSAFTALSRSVHHYVRGTISGCQLTLQAVDLNGTVFDSYVLNRCNQANDAAPPTVSITEPGAGANVSGTTLVRVQASDDVRVEKVDLWIDGVLRMIDLQAPYEFLWNTTALADGSHTIEARAYDIDGNRVSTGTRTVNVKNATSVNPDVVLYASETTARAGNWVVEADATAAGGTRIRYPDAGGPKLTTAFANPTHYFETTFNAQAGIAYRLWMRGKADANSTNNDSAWVQFSDSVDSGGTPVFRIGTTSATMFNLEECTGCGLSAWGWNDNLFQGLGPLISFATSGLHTIRVQLREDGLAIDQIVLSPQQYLNNAPGATKNDSTILPKSNNGSQITLVRQPYLQQVTHNSAAIVWATREPGTASTRYWTSSFNQPQSAKTETRFFPASSTGMPFDYYQHEARLGSLTPATLYNYDLFLNQTDVSPGLVDHFTTAIAPGSGSVSFVAFGDSGTLFPQQFQIANLIAGETFDLALHAGDIAYENGTYLQFHDTFFNVYQNWLRSRPVYPCIGNHDDRTSSALPYRDLFFLPENSASSVFPDHKERYYSFDYGPVHFVVLDSELSFLDPARRQEQLN